MKWDIQNITKSAVLGWKSPIEVISGYAPRYITSLKTLRVPEHSKNESRFLTMVKMNEDIRKKAYQYLVSRKTFNYPTDALFEGQIVFKKRTQFSRHQNPKLQIKIIDAFEVLSRVGTGLYRVKHIIEDYECLLPICQMIETRLTRGEAQKVLREING